MEQDTSLSATISVTEQKAEYNACARRVLSEKIVLAHILVAVAKEFSHMKPEEVVLQYVVELK